MSPVFLNFVFGSEFADPPAAPKVVVGGQAAGVRLMIKRQNFDRFFNGGLLGGLRYIDSLISLYNSTLINLLEASRRIELLYTDLQSAA